MAKKNNTILWVLGGIGIIVAGLFLFKVIEIKPGEGISAGDFWLDRPPSGGYPPVPSSLEPSGGGMGI